MPLVSAYAQSWGWLEVVLARSAKRGPLNAVPVREKSVRAPHGRYRQPDVWSDVCSQTTMVVSISGEEWSLTA